MLEIFKNPWCTGVIGVGLGCSVALLLSRAETEEEPMIPTVYMESAVVAPTNQNESTNGVPSNILQTSESWKAIQAAFTVATLLESQDYDSLSPFIHPEKGVRLTPYSTVDFDLDRVLTGEQLKNEMKDTTVYNWGIQDGSGFPLNLTTADYFAQFVVPMKYTMAPYVALDTILISGNSLENITEAYPEGRFVDFSFRGIDPELGGMDWSSLKLVFEPVGDTFYLVGIVRGQWTI